MKLLIVDDSNIMRKAIGKYLSEFNLEIVGNAENGEKAVELFKEHLPDLVTLDITMPRMDGLTCLSKMMEIKPDARVLIISALKDNATAIQAVKLGARGFLSKPFNEKTLQEEITACLK
ncbi:MAG: response regulator [Spirochaetia bacterium]|nr:response regulator [Spirochaetia bacterium]